MPVEAGDLTPESRVGLVGCCGRQGGSFGFEPGPAEHGSQLPWGLLVGFDLQWMPPSGFGCAGVDGPGLSLLPAPVPGEVFDGLVDVVGDGVNVGGVWRARLMATYPSSRPPPSAKRWAVSKVAPWLR